MFLFGKMKIEIESLRVETERETKSTNKMPRKHRIRSHFSAFAIIFEITKTNRIWIESEEWIFRENSQK